MTTIRIQIEDASTIQKVLDFVTRLKGVKVLPDTPADDELLEAMQQMDNHIYEEVTHDELHQLIFN